MMSHSSEEQQSWKAFSFVGLRATRSYVLVKVLMRWFCALSEIVRVRRLRTTSCGGILRRSRCIDGKCAGSFEVMVTVNATTV